MNSFGKMQKKKLHIVQIENIKNQNYVTKIYMNEYTSLFLCPHKVYFYVHRNTELITELIGSEIQEVSKI